MATVADASGNSIFPLDKHIPTPNQSIMPAQHQFTITPSDTVNFLQNTREIWCTTGGDVVVVMPDGTSKTYTLVNGQRLPVIAKRVNATSTTASGLIGWW